MLFLIKGINRQIIEVTEMENIYYERALLVIKPEYADAQKELLEKEAKKVLKEMGAPSMLKRHNKIFYWALRLGGAAAIGAGLATTLMLI